MFRASQECKLHKGRGIWVLGFCFCNPRGTRKVLVLVFRCCGKNEWAYIYVTHTFLPAVSGDLQAFWSRGSIHLGLETSAVAQVSPTLSEKGLCNQQRLPSPQAGFSEWGNAIAFSTFGWQNCNYRRVTVKQLTPSQGTEWNMLNARCF